MAGSILNGHPDPDDFAEFASAVATRYSGKISAYELWNEPNGVIFYSPVSPEDYTDLPQGRIPRHQGGRSRRHCHRRRSWSSQDRTRITMNAPTFVQRMYAAGAHGYF